ncbi:MAG: YybH family protein [Solirubrobacteraceae bacterium]
MTVAEVNVVAQAFHDAVANRDAAALAGLYHEDGRFLPPNMEPAEGHDAIQAAMQALLDMGATSLDVEPLDVREAGDETIEYGRYVLGIQPPGGEPMTDVGKYLVVHETRGDGTTKILFDCFNSNTPPAG